MTIRSSILAMGTLLAMEAVLTDGAVAGAPATPKKAERKVLPVTMTDGRVVEFTIGKGDKVKKMLKTTLIPGEDNYGGPAAVRFDFVNGVTLTYAIVDKLQTKFAVHGASQKIGDETAGEDDVDDAVLAVEEIIERLSKEDGSGWTAERKAGDGMGGTSVLLKALVEWQRSIGKITDENAVEKTNGLKAWLKPKSQAEKHAMRNEPRLKPIVDRLEAEKNAKAANVDASALLAGI